MRNLKKLLAVVVAVALVLTSMTAAFAATTNPQADAIAALKLMQGNDGDMMLDNDLARDQAVKIIITLTGNAAEVEKLTAADVDAALEGFADAAALKASWSAKWYAYAVKNGIIEGYKNEDGELVTDFAGVLYGKQFATMLMKAFGYKDVNYATSVTELSELEGSKVADEKADDGLTRADAIAYLFGALTAKNADGKTVVETYVGSDAALLKAAQDAGLIAPPAPVNLAVDTVSSNNLREIFVTFNKEVNKDTITTANFTADSKIVAATLLDDKMTVKLTIADPAAATSNFQQSTIDLVVKNVKDAAGNAIAETKKSVTLFDTAIPEAIDYKFTGPQTIEITMSEPVCPTHSAVTAVLDNGIYGAKAEVKADEKTIVVSLGTVIPEGAHKLVVKGAKDFANYQMLDKEFAITYTKDSSVPTVTVASATQTKVTLNFSKAVKFEWASPNTAATYFYHTYTAYQPDAVKDASGNAIVSGSFYDKVVLDFTTKPLPAGDTKVVVVNKVGDKYVTDRYGITLGSDVILTANISTDNTPPTIAKVEAVRESSVEITFSEDVTGADTKASYVFKKADGTVIDGSKYSLGTYNSTTNKQVVTFTPALAGGAYSVEVKDIKDKSVSTNAMVVVPVSFTVTDKTAIVTVSAVTVVNGNVLYVTYPENMMTTGANSVLEKANYMWGSTAETASPVTNAAISVFGTADKVKIEFPAGYNIPVGQYLYVKNVADAAGNVIEAMFLKPVIGADSAPKVTGIKTVALNKMEITLNKEINSIDAGNIEVNGKLVAQASYVNKDGKATITVILTDDNKLANEGEVPSSVNITGSTVNIKSMTGVAMATGSALTVGAVSDVTSVSDGVAPAVKDVYYVTGSGVICVRFTEEIKSETIALLGANGFKVGDKTVTGAAIQSSTAGTTGAAIVVLYGDFGTEDTAGALDVTYTPGNITDKSGNALAAFTRTDDLKKVGAYSDIP